MYIPFSYFGGDSCVYYVALNQDVFGGNHYFNYTDCNNITQSVLVENFTAKYFSVNPTQPTGIDGIGSRISNTGIDSPIINLPLKNEYYEIITHSRPTNSPGAILQSNLYVPYFSSSISFDYFSGNTVGDVLGITSKTYTTSYPQFYSGYNNIHTIIPLQDTSSLTTTVDYLIVAGGGGGGNPTGGGGGGAGGLLSGSLLVSGSTTTTIYVGNGGSAGSNGNNSFAFGLTSLGGGAGASLNTTGSFGGSGGGGTADNITIWWGGSGSIGQGNDGGGGRQREGGGGGGASSDGVSVTGPGPAGNGGSGSQWLDGNWYAGGGGGGTDNSNSGSGGIGGGGNGGRYLTYESTPGQPNTGGGGGGGGYDLNNDGAPGGSGIVKIRYQGPKRAVGGDYTYYDNGYTYHVYTSTNSTSSFEFIGGSYPIRDYSTIPTASLAVTESLVSLIDTIYTQSFDKFNYNISYDVTPSLNNLFVDYSDTYSYVTSSAIPYIQFDEWSSEAKTAQMNLNSIVSALPIEELTLVAVYNVPSFSRTISDTSSNRFINIFGDSSAQRDSRTNLSQFNPFGMWLSGSVDNLNSLIIQHHSNDIILPFSSSIDGWHISQMSYNKSTNTITWANDNITGSSSVSSDNWYRITPAINYGSSPSGDPYGFATGSKFRMFAVYTSSLSADELLENYNFISQSLI